MQGPDESNHLMAYGLQRGEMQQHHPLFSQPDEAIFSRETHQAADIAVRWHG
ncbi:hypothetical protein CDEN61S_01476 [Castellaniella denitrificans]